MVCGDHSIRVFIGSGWELAHEGGNTVLLKLF